MDRVQPRWKTPALGLLAVGITMAMAIAALSPTQGDASSHREAPLTAADPQVDATDLYAFVSPDDPDSVTIVSNWIPFQEPAGGPNFYAFSEDVRYEINVSNDGDAIPEAIYRWKFKNHYRNPNTFLYNTGPVESINDPDLNFYQTYKLVRKVPGKRGVVLAQGLPVAPSDVGNASFPDYEAVSNQAITTLPNGGKTWAGQAEDPFFLDLRVFDLLYGADFSEVGDDTLAGFNVNSMALQIPASELAKNSDTDGNPVIGVWSTASRRSTRIQQGDGTDKFKGPFVQLSRLGMPLVNEVVVPVGAKDYFNGSKPKNDGQFLGAVNDPELPRLIEAVYGIPAPDSNEDKPGIQRDDLIQVFLTGIPDLNQPAGVQPSEMLRLNMTVAPCEPGTCAEYSALGVIGGDIAGFPNGRRLADDVIDISLQVVEGELIGNPNDLSDGVQVNDKNFRSIFPYVGLPHRGSDPAPHDS